MRDTRRVRLLVSRALRIFRSCPFERSAGNRSGRDREFRFDDDPLDRAEREGVTFEPLLATCG